jgi:hypothetical protein
MQIDASAEQLSKANFSMRESLDPDSKLTVESDRQSVKQFRPSASTEEDISTNKRDEQL